MNIYLSLVIEIFIDIMLNKFDNVKENKID